MVPPPAKKRKLGASAAPAAGVRVATRRRSRRTAALRPLATRHQKPTLSAELLARVASFSSLGRDLLNLCFVAGPKDCALIRHAYLRDNSGYLEYFLDRYLFDGRGRLRLGGDSDRETCRDRYLAWMAVNTDWRKQVTAERVERLMRAVIKSGEGGIPVANHRFIPLCNPAVAIELGLMDPLKYLVEEKGINVNSCQWNTYQYVTPDRTSYHLLLACMKCQNIEAFRYLLGREDIDIHSYSRVATADGDYWTIVEEALFLDCCTEFVRELLDHPSFDFAAVITTNDGDEASPLHFAIDILQNDGWVSLPTWKANFQLLLSAGANPYMEVGGHDAIEYANDLLGENPQSQGLRDAVEILEDWVAIK